MGRTDYIAQAGIGFDIDRSSAKRSIGVFESFADTISTIATKKAAEDHAKAEKDYKSTLDNLKKINDKADDDLLSGTKASAKAAQQAIQKSWPKEMSEKKRAKLAGTDELKAYDAAFERSMGGMSKS